MISHSLTEHTLLSTNFHVEDVERLEEFVRRVLCKSMTESQNALVSTVAFIQACHNTFTQVSTYHRYGQRFIIFLCSSSSCSLSEPRTSHLCLLLMRAEPSVLIVCFLRLSSLRQNARATYIFPTQHGQRSLVFPFKILSCIRLCCMSVCTGSALFGEKLKERAS